MSKPKATPLPTKEDGTLDAEVIERMFMESPFIDWTRFAEGNGWHPLRTRVTLPVASWQAVKKKELAEKQIDVIQSSLYEQGLAWHVDVLKTLSAYPKANDIMFGIALRKLDDMNKHPENYSLEDMRKMSVIINQVTEGKYKSLLLHNWNAELAKRTTDNEREAEEVKTRGIQAVIKGYPEGATIEEIQKMMDEYIDKPQAVVGDGNEKT